MAANTNPIFSAYGDVQGGDLIGVSNPSPGPLSLVSDYTGQGLNHASIFHADQTNGGFIQRIRFKSNGVNGTAAVARIYYNNNSSRFLGQAAAPGSAPSGTPSVTGGTLLAGNYFAKIVSIDQYGGKSVASTENATAVTITGTTTTGSINWTWAAPTGTLAASYQIYVGPVAGGQLTYFTSSTNSFLQTTAIGTRESLSSSVSNNNTLIGELSLPIIASASSNAATADIDYTLNMALPPGGRILVGISTTNANNSGWIVTGIGGEY
jgi:hypothetical protein